MPKQLFFIILFVLVLAGIGIGELIQYNIVDRNIKTEIDRRFDEAVKMIELRQPEKSATVNWTWGKE